MDEHHIGHRLTPKNNICTAYPLADSTKSEFLRSYLGLWYEMYYRWKIAIYSMNCQKLIILWNISQIGN